MFRHWTLKGKFAHLGIKHDFHKWASGIKYTSRRFMHSKEIGSIIFMVKESEASSDYQGYLRSKLDLIT